MIKKVLFSLFIFLSLIAVVASTGCSTVASLLTAATGTDPGRVTTPLAAVSGTVTKSGSTFSVNLSSIIVGGSAVTSLDASKFKIFIGGVASVDSTYTPVATTITTTTASKLDIVFIMDNTGSMSGRIKSVKDSIVAFTSSLEASGANVKFGVVSFGDNTSEQSALDLPASAEGVSTWLNALSGVGGGDTPENPLDSIMYANSSFTWRSGSQKVFIVITDNPCHQTGDGTTYTARTLASVEASLSGSATVYVVSPKIDYGATSPWSYTGTADVRWLADGYGWFAGVATATYGSTRPYTGTGGKWIELASSGDIDLTTLGISTTVTKGYTLSFTYTPSAIGTYYIHVLVDTNGDGVWDADGLLTISVTTLSEKGLLNSGGISGPAGN